MKFDRASYEPGAVIDFFQDGLEFLGVVCERTWYDQLHVMAEGQGARLWNADGALVERNLFFLPADQGTSRNDAQEEVFPGCPLTFRLVETLRSAMPGAQKVVLGNAGKDQPPSSDVAQKLWAAQFGSAVRWTQEEPFKAAWHFSNVMLVRCEIQAIDQHWSLHRIAISLPDGASDPGLAANLQFSQTTAAEGEAIEWPAAQSQRWAEFLRAVLTREIDQELTAVRVRQEAYLRRELERIGDYFLSYERELAQRGSRQHKADAKTRFAERLAAAKAEHERRRHDQVRRHEIRVIPHVDAVLLAAEPAWRALITVTQGHDRLAHAVTFVPRSRHWVIESSNTL